MGFIHLQIEWNPWLGGYHPEIPILSALYPQLNLLKLPPPRENNSWVHHWQVPQVIQFTVIANKTGKVLRMYNTLLSLMLLIPVPDNGFVVKLKLWVISGFSRVVAVKCAVLGCYASSGNITYHYSPRNDPEERSSKPKHIASFRHCLKTLDVTDEVTFCSICLLRQEDVPI
jgi:hypothetical protein